MGRAYIIELIITLSDKEKEWCINRLNTLSPTVRKYLELLLSAAPSNIDQEEHDFVRQFKPSVRNWIRREALDFIYKSLDRLHIPFAELRSLINRTQHILIRGHNYFPLIKHLRIRVNRYLEKRADFFIPVPWVLELLLLSESAIGRFIVKHHHYTIHDINMLVQIEHKRLKAIKETLSVGAYFGEDIVSLKTVYKCFNEFVDFLNRCNNNMPTHKTIIAVYLYLSLFYNQVGCFEDAENVANQLVDLSNNIIDVLEKHLSNNIALADWQLKTLMDLLVGMLVGISIIRQNPVHVDYSILTVSQETILKGSKLIRHIISEGDFVFPSSWWSLVIRNAVYLATSAKDSESQQWLNYVKLNNKGKILALKPIERFELHVAQFWNHVWNKRFSEAYKILELMDTLEISSLVTHSQKETLKFIFAIITKDYKEMERIGERLYAWSRRHQWFMPSLAKLLRTIAKQSFFWHRRQDWLPAYQKLLAIYRKYPFYISTIEEYTLLSRVVLYAGRIHLIKNSLLDRSQGELIRDFDVIKLASCNINPLKKTIITLQGILRDWVAGGQS